MSGLAPSDASCDISANANLTSWRGCSERLEQPNKLRKLNSGQAAPTERLANAGADAETHTTVEKRNSVPQRMLERASGAQAYLFSPAMERTTPSIQPEWAVTEVIAERMHAGCAGTNANLRAHTFRV